jgi:DNA primase large subunit
MDDYRERQDFINGLDFAWEMVGEKEKVELADELRAATGAAWKGEEEGWFKVEWEKVPELVEQRRILLKRGMAYVPIKEQSSLVVAEFRKRLDQALEVSGLDYVYDKNLILTVIDDCPRSSTT